MNFRWPCVKRVGFNKEVPKGLVSRGFSFKATPAMGTSDGPQDYLERKFTDWLKQWPGQAKTRCQIEEVKLDS